MLNDEQLDAAMDALKSFVRAHLKDPTDLNKGRREGAFEALTWMGFGDAALEAVREVYEDEGLRHSARAKIEIGGWRYDQG